MVYQWTVFIANLDPIQGSEQGRTRPVLIISDENINQILPVVNVLPITSYQEGRTVYPNEVLLAQDIANLRNTSLVLTYQIRTLDKNRLQKRIGVLEDETLREEIKTALKFQLDL